MASGHVNRIKRPNTWLHRPMLQNVKKALANSEPSTHGTNRTSRDVRSLVAIGGWWMGATHFQMKTLKHVATEMALHVLAYNMKRVISILGVGGLMEAIRA